ncbi:Oidioi.mRNA.OKI2018_I69.XSR.g16313.t1.cds [Oikopleura dioica]|uniref:Oidioi.mRNA.OKI2018_I69.XSR.g16313.t1.cds n=1 Tax=Oikopleura dioica TaxID=34765 RepID=A0ABN7SQ12_OIKDI|nr:Oidioi.mRNA.OKI2018_I69.XSR.g16313.t1.cds [Oikopleura dioica]
MYNLATNADVAEPYYFNRSHRVYDEETGGLPLPRTRKTNNNVATEPRCCSFWSFFRGTIIWSLIVLLLFMMICVYDHMFAKPRFEDALWLLEKAKRT